VRWKDYVTWKNPDIIGNRTRDLPVCSVNNICCISLFHRAFQFTMCNGPTNALVCNKALSQMSHIKTFKITPTCFDRQLIIIRELFDPG
jgi:hypothetical protein